MHDNGHSTDLATTDVAAPTVMGNGEIDATFRLAKALAMSGLFKDAKQAEQAFGKILVGRDLGLSPTQALMSLHIIEGKPELSANLQATLVKRTWGYDYRVTQLDDAGCVLEFVRDGQVIGVSSFTMKDATQAGLAGRGVWKAYPRNMLFARAMSNGVAFFCPEVTGGIRIYSEGEVGGEELPSIAPTPAVAIAAAPDVEVVEAPPAIISAERADMLLSLRDCCETDAGWTPAQVKMVLVDVGVADNSHDTVAIRSMTVEQADLFQAACEQGLAAATEALPVKA